jgi:hypothetical protein
MDDQQNKVMCARAPECLKDGFIHDGEPTAIFNGKLYHKECAERQQAENNAP